MLTFMKRTNGQQGFSMVEVLVTMVIIAFGLLGVALAAPLTAAMAVLVRRIYAEGWLGRPAAGEEG